MQHLLSFSALMEAVLQLNIPVQNAPSSLAKVGDTLRAANVNILAICCTEGAPSTIIHLVVDDPETAKIVLKPFGKITTTEVLSLLIKNKPGCIASIGRAIAGANINIRYIYSTTTGKEARVYVAVEGEVKKALEGLKPWKSTFIA